MNAWQIVFYFNNCNKIATKIKSFDKVLSDLKPSIFRLEETKQKGDDPAIKCDNLINYQTFELSCNNEAAIWKTKLPSNAYWKKKFLNIRKLSFILTDG